MDSTEATDNQPTMKEALAAAEAPLTIANEKTKVATVDGYNETDIFAWANNLVQYVDELKIDLYFFNKNYTVYRTKLTGDVARQLRPLFLDDVIEYILGGIETGLIVRDFEAAEKEDGVLQKTRTGNVEKLTTVLNWIRNEQHNIETFDDAEHDLKRIKGVAAHCSHPDMPKSFTLFKNLPTSQIMKGPTAWTLKDGVFKPFDTMTALKIPAENQLLVVDQDLFVFNQTKLKQLFGYDAKASYIAAKKVEEIEANFRLNFADGFGLQSLVKGSPATIKKLQKIEPSLVKQEDLVSHAEDMGVELMVDESGAIIIMDDKDLKRFVNLLNDDYVESNMTGQRYEILTKRVLKPTDSDSQL